MEEGTKGSLPSQVRSIRCSDACLCPRATVPTGQSVLLSEHVARRTGCSVNHTHLLESYLVVHTYIPNVVRSNGGQPMLPHTH